jgi:hypothetical protein
MGLPNEMKLCRDLVSDWRIWPMSRTLRIAEIGKANNPNFHECSVNDSVKYSIEITLSFISKLLQLNSA